MPQSPAVARLLRDITAAADAAPNREAFLAELQMAIEDIPGARVTLYGVGPHVLRDAMKDEVRRGAAGRPLAPAEIQKILKEEATLHGIDPVETAVTTRIEEAVRALLAAKR